jgi:hypothetical protein
MSVVLAVPILTATSPTYCISYVPPIQETKADHVKRMRRNLAQAHVELARRGVELARLKRDYEWKKNII